MGGAQRYVFDLAANLNKKGMETIVASGTEKTELQKLLTLAQIPVQTVSHLRRNIHPLADLKAIRELAGLYDRLRPDIVHLNSSKAGVLGSLAACLAGYQNVIFTAHGFAFLEPGGWLKKRFYFWAEKLATKFRARIITVSEWDRNAAVHANLCATEKIITIHNGLRSPTFLDRGAARKKLGALAGETFADSDLILGSIAHDYPTKDLPTLKQAFLILNKGFPRLKLVIIGRGSRIGPIPEASRLLAGFDVFALSSAKEGFPYTILEAMAAGLPIAATAVGGIPEAITSGREGLLVPPHNPQALAQAIKKIIADPQLAKTLGTNARERVKKFGEEKMLAQTTALYQELISRPAA